MNREIKFREWDSVREEIYRNGMGMSYGTREDYDDSISFRFSHEEGGERILMQYTGLKDKNGKEIYEGDILTSVLYPYQSEGKYNYHGIVEYDEELAAFVNVKRVVNPERRGISDGISDYFEETDGLEIIGNIYENPELLDVASNG